MKYSCDAELSLRVEDLHLAMNSCGFTIRPSMIRLAGGRLAAAQ